MQVRASRPQSEIEGDERDQKLSVWTDLLRGVDASEAHVLTTLSAMNRTASTYAFCCPDPGDGKVVLQSTAYVHPGNSDWLPLSFAGQAALQPIAAQFRAEAAGQLLGGEPDRSRSGPPDDILNLEQALYAPAGASQSRWTDTGEFEHIAEMHGRSDAAFGMASEDGLTLEIPFGDETALLQIMADQRHPVLGSGLLRLLRLPIAMDDDEAAERANALNAQEAVSWTQVPLLGAWAANDGNLSHSGFIPNALYRHGIAENVVLWDMARVRWARQKLLPDEDDLPLHEIMSRRA